MLPLYGAISYQHSPIGEYWKKLTQEIHTWFVIWRCDANIMFYIDLSIESETGYDFLNNTLKLQFYVYFFQRSFHKRSKANFTLQKMQKKKEKRKWFQESFWEKFEYRNKLIAFRKEL